MTTYTDEVNIYNPEAVGEGIENASQTATNYITSVTNDGIVVADAGKGASSSGAITSNTTGWHLGGALEYIRSGVARFWIGLKDAAHDLTPTVIIGKRYVSGATDNESHMELDYHSLQMVDKEGETYFYVSDLRDASGTVEIEESFTGTGIRTDFFVKFPISSVVEVTINDVVTTAYSRTPSFYGIEFTTAPELNDVIVITYRTSSDECKAYTFGKRSSTNQKLGAMSVVEGYRNVASGRYSHAEGLETEASENYAHSEGYGTKATYSSAHAEGSHTTASGGGAHSEGQATKATSASAHSEGTETIASSGTAHSEGYKTIACGDASHSQNESTIAAGRAQTAIGRFNVADVITDTFVGDGSTKRFTLSTTCGGQALSVTIDGNDADGWEIYTPLSESTIHFTNAPESGAQIVVTYASGKGTYAFIIGNGTANKDRSNALAVKWDGTLETATPIPIASGGTGAATAAAAWTALGGGSIGKKNSLAASDIPNLAASKITSGDIAAAQLSNAAKYVNGTKEYKISSGGGNASVAVSVSVPDGYAIRGVARISAGVDAASIYGWTWSGSTVTVSVHNLNSSGWSSNKTMTVGVICTPS